ncbi:hypothetical protein BKA63DRAFT_497674 [Paraphoma chrysanthemicola]|nr:hypothetical protein BKA63DRAFT_227094 [Paraphoma chrysanthemicola]KAH7061828.1 hypothetical protein BKA63DRAFT_497674 [Paraphoma chrysanthemicola]
MITRSSIHFLGFPRELRNIIYSYLSQDVEFQWRWKYWPLAGRDEIATVRLENVPCLSALLTSTQVYHEYSASACSRAMTASLTVVLGREDLIRPRKDYFRGSIDQLLSRITRLNIIIYTRLSRDEVAPDFWFEVYLLSQVLQDRSPQMTSLKINAFAPITTREERVERANNFCSRSFFPPPRDLLNCFSLTRHAECYYLVSDGNHRVVLESPEISSEDSVAEAQGWVLIGKWLYASTNEQGL